VTLLDSSGNAVTGLTPAQLNMLVLMRKSDGKYYDGAAWQATKTDLAVIEQNAINSPGLYYYDTPASTEDELIITVDTPEAANVPQVGIIKVGDLADTLVETLRHLKNKLTIDAATGKLQLWNDAGTATLHEWPLTDKDGKVVRLTGTGPANRGVAL
jgi:hypothetical protein